MASKIEFQKEETNAQLIAKANEAGAKIVSEGTKPTKAEIIASIELFNDNLETNDSEDADLGQGLSEPADIETLMEESAKAEADARKVSIENKDTEEVKKERALTPREKKRKQYAELMALERVMITSNNTKQTKTDLITISWGNRLLGYHTDRILLNKPWHVRRGALNNVKTVEMTEHYMEGEQVATRQVPMYNIVQLGLLSKEEYADMAQKQKVRNAAAEAQGLI